MSERVCFTLRVWPERIDEYRERHRELWPEMRESLLAAGRRDYSLFLADDGLVVGYYRVEDRGASTATLATDPVVTRWNASMAPLFVDPEPRVLSEVFRLKE